METSSRTAGLVSASMLEGLIRGWEERERSCDRSGDGRTAVVLRSVVREARVVLERAEALPDPDWDDDGVMGWVLVGGVAVAVDATSRVHGPTGSLADLPLDVHRDLSGALRLSAAKLLAAADHAQTPERLFRVVAR